MKTFADKIRESRTLIGKTQAQLAEEVGVSERAIQTYERGQKFPRQGTLLKIAAALGVSAKYLKDDACIDPREDIDVDAYVLDAQERFGTRDARDVNELLSANEALFAGGELSDEQKDAFFQAVMSAYLKCKKEAHERFTPGDKK